MEAFILLIAISLLGAFASNFGADSRELDDQPTSDWPAGGDADPSV